MATAGLGARRVKELLGSDSTYATVLVAICIDSFGTECFDWDPESLLLELEEDYNVQLSPANRDKINGFLTALTTDQFHTDPFVFWQVGNALSGSPGDFQVGADPLTVDEAAWAVVEISLSDMPDDGQEQPTFSPDVASMVGAVLQEEGFSSPPQFLKFAEIPPRKPAMDPETEQALAARHSRLEEEMVEAVQQRLQELNLQLQQLPLAGQRSQPSPTSPRDFLGELLSAARAPKGSELAGRI